MNVPDTARILGTTKVVCTAKQPAGEGRSRLGFAGPFEAGRNATTLGPLGLSVVMPDQAAGQIEVGTHLTILITDGVIS